MRYKIGLFFLLIANLITTIGGLILIYFLLHFPGVCGFGGCEKTAIYIIILIALVLSAILLFIIIISWVIFKKITEKKTEWSIGLLIIGTVVPITMILLGIDIFVFYLITAPHFIAFALLHKE